MPSKPLVGCRLASVVRGFRLDGPWLLLMFEATALLYRAPALLYIELNWDESLYKLIGTSLALGHAPYTEYWDRKPVGIFLIMAAIRLCFGGSVIAVRLVTSMFVGLSAFLVALIGRRVFRFSPRMGMTAGFLYILYSVKNGGAGTNTELFYVPIGLAGFYLGFEAIKVVGTRALLLGFGSGLLIGGALQIKQTAIFDALAYSWLLLIVGFDDIRQTGIARLGWLAAVSAAGTLTPTILVAVWYALIGQMHLFLIANVVADLGLFGGDAPGFDLAGLFAGLRGFGGLFIGTGAMLIVGRLAATSREMRRGYLAILAWLCAMALSLLFSRRFADHFFLEALPVLALATSLGLVMIAEFSWFARLGAKGMLVCLALPAVVGGTSEFDAAAEVMWHRHVDGIAHWGDRTATISAAIESRLRGREDIYVFGQLLGIYEATGTFPPTRFPFAEHLFAGYAPVDGEREMRRILRNKPGFIIVDDNWLDAGPAFGPDATRVFAAMIEALSRDYVIDGHVGLFRSRGGGYISGSIGATVFRLAGIPGIDVDRSLQYDTTPDGPRPTSPEDAPKVLPN